MRYWVCTLLLIFILTGCNNTTRNASQEQQGTHARGTEGMLQHGKINKTDPTCSIQRMTE